MSVRVAYVSRENRGLSVRTIWLYGQASQASWDAPEHAPQGAPGPRDIAQPEVFPAAAEWARTNLQSARSRDSLDMLCMDVSGSVCTWVASPTSNPRMVAILARQGAAMDADAGTNSGADAEPELTPASYFAPTPLDSSIEPLPHARSLDAGETGDRIAAIATTDLPARLLTDALDRAGVRVGSIATYWHALAMAWDPPAKTIDTTVVPRTCAIVTIDPQGRLVWCWSLAGRVLTGGSVRLRTSPNDNHAPLCTRDDAARVINEWLSWGLQLQDSPSRIICVLPEQFAGVESMDALTPGELASTLAAQWKGAAVDAVLTPDPTTSTMQRLVRVLEETPSQHTLSRGTSLSEVSSRPGTAHRRMFLWGAGAICAASLALLALGYKFRQTARAEALVAEQWRTSWKAPLKDAFPDVVAKDGKDELWELNRRIKQREDASSRPADIARTQPVMQELETVSLVLASPNVELRSIQIASDLPPQIVAITPSTRDAEALLEGLKRVSGGVLEGWAATIRPEGQTEKRTGTYTARWPAQSNADKVTDKKAGGQ